jgi:thioredoxin-dependent peroxiredoxin
MKRSILSLCALLAISIAATAVAEELKAGDAAPAFRLVDADGKEYTLDDFKGKQGVVLAWFPRAFTPGCTIEIKSIRDSATELDGFDVSYFMVSLDPPEKNAEFAEEHGCDFPVLSDPDGETAKAYDVGAPGALFAKRWTFFIGADGEIKHVERGVNVSTHGADIVQKLDELGFPKKESAG